MMNCENCARYTCPRRGQGVLCRNFKAAAEKLYCQSVEEMANSVGGTIGVITVHEQSYEMTDDGGVTTIIEKEYPVVWYSRRGKRVGICASPSHGKPGEAERDYPCDRNFTLHPSWEGRVVKTWSRESHGMF